MIPGQTITDLYKLVAEAQNLGGTPTCAYGHDWVTFGGRGCPRECASGIGQTAYECARCGEIDYGYRGGPGHADCFGDRPGVGCCGLVCNEIGE